MQSVKSAAIFFSPLYGNCYFTGSSDRFLVGNAIARDRGEKWKQLAKEKEWPCLLRSESIWVSATCCSFSYKWKSEEDFPLRWIELRSIKSDNNGQLLSSKYQSTSAISDSALCHSCILSVIGCRYPALLCHILIFIILYHSLHSFLWNRIKLQHAIFYCTLFNVVRSSMQFTYTFFSKLQHNHYQYLFVISSLSADASLSAFYSFVTLVELWNFIT